MKTKERTKNPMRSEREPIRKDTIDREPTPQQPEQGQPEPMDRHQGGPREPMDRRPGAPRERSDEETIGRPVQLDGEPMDDLDEPDPEIKGDPQRERRGAR